MVRLFKVCAVIGILAVAASAACGSIIFSDNWSDGNVFSPTFSASGADWTIESGVFSADVTPANVFNPFSLTNILMFGTDPSTRISVNFGTTQPNTPVEARFKLYQTNNAMAFYQFVVGLKDSATGYGYFEQSVAHPDSYGAPGGLSGFHSLIATGTNPNDWTFYSGDVAGTALSSDGRTDYMKFRIDPPNGLVEFWQAIDADPAKSYDDPTLTYTRVAHWDNFFNIASVDQLYFTNNNGVVSWFVDDVEIDSKLASGSISGNIVPADYIGKLSGVLVEVEFTKDQTVTTTYVNLDDLGNFTMPEVPVGTYDISVKACCWLRKVVGTIQVSALADTNIGNISLIAGDIDGDNEVTSTDLSILGLNLGIAGD